MDRTLLYCHTACFQLRPLVAFLLLNGTVYRRAVSIILFHTSPGLLIFLWAGLSQHALCPILLALSIASFTFVPLPCISPYFPSLP